MTSRTRHGLYLVVILALFARAIMGEEEGTRAKFARFAELASTEGAAVEATVLYDELVAMGPDALPAYREGLTGNIEEQRGAILLLAKLGRNAAPAVPELHAATASPDPKVRELAARLLQRLDQGEATIVRLTEMLSDEELGVVSVAAELLGDLGPKAAEAVPALIEAGRRPTLGFGTWMSALGQIGAHPELAVPALIEALDGSHSATAAKELGRFGPEARPAVPALLEAMEVALARDLEQRSLAAIASGTCRSALWSLTRIYELKDVNDPVMAIERLEAVIEREHAPRLRAISDRIRDAGLTLM